MRDPTTPWQNGCAVAALLSMGACAANPRDLAPGGADSGSSLDASLGAEGATPVAGFEIAIDPSFGTGGNLEGDLAGWIPVGVMTDAEGRLVVSGPGDFTSLLPGETVLRFDANGTLDPGFGASGRAMLAVDADRWAQAVRILPDGRIGIIGSGAFDGGQAAFAARLAADGGLDPSFVGQPIFSVSCGMLSTAVWQNDGSGAIFGSAAIVRFQVDGATDGGEIPAPATTGALDPDGRIWTGFGNGVARYLDGGALDPSFGQAGVVDLWPGDAAAQAPVIQSLVLETNGDAVVVASQPNSESYDVVVARLTPSGAIDATFGLDGSVTLPTTGAPVGLGLLSDGRIVVWTSYGEVLAIGADGVAQGSGNLDVPGSVMAATLDATERLVVVGIGTNDPQNQTWFIRRYLLY